MNSVIGIDFDNTIVIYDGVFHSKALNHKLIPSDIPADKTEIRDYIRSHSGNDAWTELQAEVYSAGIRDCLPAEGLVPFLNRCFEQDIIVKIISHKTPYAAIGDQVDLRTPAREWIGRHLPDHKNLQIYFESTKEDKLNRIKVEDCDYFIDDLTEILLDPNFPSHVCPILYGRSDILKLNSSNQWQEIEDFIKESVLNTERLQYKLERDSEFKFLLKHPCGSGANSTTYFGTDSDQRPVIVKQYLNQNTPQRSGVEYKALSDLFREGFNSIPEPLWRSSDDSECVYRFVSGRTLSPEDINERTVLDAAKTLASLQDEKYRELFKHHPDAKEAAFSISDQIQLVDERCRFVIGQPEIDGDLKKELSESWEAVKQYSVSEADSLGLDFCDVLPREERVLSPSDVGFHNILYSADHQKITLIDFEYFGWDDPVKMVCDFILQPAVPIPDSMQKITETILCRELNLDSKAVGRLKVLKPVLSFKWCLIMGNVLNRLPENRRAEKIEEMRVQLSKTIQLTGGAYV